MWVPPEYGDAIACICSDGSLSIWEETAEGMRKLRSSMFAMPMDSSLL